jgi:sporulation protein YlmC with PRC-barrel domain
MRERRLAALIRRAIVPVASLCLAMPAYAAGEVPASELLGKSVQNLQGEELGEIADLVIDLNTGEVRYAMLEFDPRILPDEKLFAVPARVLEKSGDHGLAYRMKHEPLEHIGMDKDRWPQALRSRQYLRDLGRAYRIAEPPGGYHAFSVAELIGMDVHNCDGERIGEIRDLAIDTDVRKVRHAMLTLDAGPAAPEKRLALPLRAFSFNDLEGELVLKPDAINAHPD